jgi:hypothetical protein
MTENELEAVSAELKGYFPAVAARLAKAPNLLVLWRRTLRPFSTRLVLDAMARAASKNSRGLELDDLLALIQHIMEEQQQTGAPRSTNTPTPPMVTTIRSLPLRVARRVRTPEDRLIAKLHCQMVYHGLNHQRPEIQKKAAAQWRQWATEYPIIQGYCIEQAEACCQFAAEPQEHTLQRA